MVIENSDPAETATNDIARCLALDIGASSGRLIEVELHEDTLTMQELARMENRPKPVEGHLCWQHESLFSEVVKGLCLAGDRKKKYDSIGVDTWGVDYVLLDEKGHILGHPVAYRDERTQGMIERFTRENMTKERLYEKTGIQFLEFNTRNFCIH